MIDFGIKDAIDILIVGVLLYYLYRLMKASSSATIFSGIMIFVVAWILVSQVFEMRLLGSIMDTAINVGALALVILFQDELRHFFSTLGNHRSMLWFRRLFSRKHGLMDTPHRDEVMAIVMACMNMSKQKIGALIVVEGIDALNEESSTGELIDAHISQRLIENIFFKNSPLHDGALLIRKLRLHSAACILPVSHDGDIPKSLGLRHRAALGISQHSDCLAIVVSEQTGGISTAYKGELTLRLTAEELETKLVEILTLE